MRLWSGARHSQTRTHTQPHTHPYDAHTRARRALDDPERRSQVLVVEPGSVDAQREVLLLENLPERYLSLAV
jgi:hypothetical protein